MGHKTMIGGTAYEVSGGRCLVAGTGYDIKKGRTLVDGTGYDVVFGKPCVVKITGTGNSSLAYVQINGTKYTSSSKVEVESGTVMTCYAYNPDLSADYGISLNGTKVQETGSYLYTIEKDITVYIASRTRPPITGTVNIYDEEE